MRVAVRETSRALARIYWCEFMLTREHLDRNRQSCEVVFQRGGHDVETVYWAGSKEEARELALEIAFRGGADAFRIVEFTGGVAGGSR